MPKMFLVTLNTTTTKEVNVVAETQEEATAKVTLTEGETVASVQEKGEVVL